MAQLLDLTTFTDERGNLTVVEKVVPFTIKRLFYIYGVKDSIRGRHRHHSTRQAAIALQGRCTIFNNDGQGQKQHFQLHAPHQCLLLEPEDWHKMYAFSPDCILMVLASEFFTPEDYIFEPYEQHDLEA